MDFTALKTAIQNAVKLNGNEEITGDILQGVLLSMVSTLGESAINNLVTAISNEATARQNGDSTLNGYIESLQGAINSINTAIGNGYVYAGIATPSSTPASGKVFYLALTAGTYTNFGNTAVTQGINILKYNGTSWSLDSFVGIDDAPTPSSQKLVKSGGVFDEVMKNGSAFDLSAYNGGATYADLNAALTALNALPTAYKRGGMSVKFVLSSDNKYVQYRLASQSFTANISYWEKYNRENEVASLTRPYICDGYTINTVNYDTIDICSFIKDIKMLSNRVPGRNIGIGQIWNNNGGKYAVSIFWYPSNEEPTTQNCTFIDGASTTTPVNGEFVIPNVAKLILDWSVFDGKSFGSGAIDDIITLKLDQDYIYDKYAGDYLGNEKFKDDFDINKESVNEIKEVLCTQENNKRLFVFDNSIFSVGDTYIDQNGILQIFYSSARWFSTDFLKIEQNTELQVNLVANDGVYVAFYSDTSESNFISSWHGNEGREASTLVPNGAKYFRASNKIYGYEGSMKGYANGMSSNIIESFNQRINDLEETATDISTLEKKTPSFYPAKNIYCVTNDDNMIFIRGLIAAKDPYLWSRKFWGQISTDEARLFPRYLRMNFASPTTRTLSMQLIGNDYTRSDVKTSNIIVKSPSSPASNINVLCLGSSTTNDGVWAGELKRRLTGTGGTPSGNNLSNISFVGRMNGQVNHDVKVEATGGWSWNTFINGETSLKFTVSGITSLENGVKYTYVDGNGNNIAVTIQENNLASGSGNIICFFRGSLPASQSGTLTKIDGTGVGDNTISFTAYEQVTWSPFVQNNTFGFTNYANRYCNGSLDVVICNLSYLNESIGEDKDFSSVVAHMKTFIDTLHTDFPSCKVLLSPGHGASPNGGCGWTYGIDSNNGDLLTDYGILFGEFRFKEVIEEFIGNPSYSSFCFMFNSLAEVDMENAFPTITRPVNLRSDKTETTQRDALHPTEEGNLMEADSVYRCFVCTVLN